MNDLTSIHNMNLVEMQDQIEKLEEIKKQWQIEYEKECELELRYSTFTVMENKGSSIHKSVSDILSARRIGANLKVFLERTDFRLQDVKSLNRQLPGLVASFKAYWIEKSKKDKNISAAIDSADGTHSIMNYIGSEILVARFNINDLKSKEAAARVATGIFNRNARSYSHEAMAVARKEIIRDHIEYVESHGLLPDDAYIQRLEDVMVRAFSKALIRKDNHNESTKRGIASNTHELYAHKNKAIGFDKGED